MLEDIGGIYNMKCNLLVEPPKLDRFYLDLRVYSVKPIDLPDGEIPKGSLVWREIYLALEIGGNPDIS